MKIAHTPTRSIASAAEFLTGKSIALNGALCIICVDTFNPDDSSTSHNDWRVKW